MVPEHWPRGPQRELGDHIIHHLNWNTLRVKGDTINNYAAQPANTGTVTVKPERLLILHDKSWQQGEQDSELDRNQVLLTVLFFNKFFKEKTIFLEQFYVHSKTEWKVHGVPVYLLLAHIKVQPPHCLHPQQGGTFVTIEEPTLTHHHHQGPWCTLKCTLGTLHFMGLDKCIMTCIHYYSLIQSSFTALKILYAPPIHFSLPPNPWSFHCLHNFAFSRMLYNWNHTVCGLFTLASFT